MKVKNFDLGEFKPVDVLITIETQEELDAVNAMCFFNNSIPNLVRSESCNYPVLKTLSENQRGILATLLNQIGDCLK